MDNPVYLLIDLLIYLNLIIFKLFAHLFSCLVIYSSIIHLFQLFSYLFTYLFFTYNLITYICGFLMPDCRCPDAPTGWHTTVIGLSGKGEGLGGVDGLTL